MSEALTRVEVVRIGDDEVAAVRGPGGEGYAVVRRMCEVLGIDYKTQHEKLTKAPWAVVGLIPTTGPDGKNYECFCLHVDSVAMWLSGIDASRVSGEARDKIVLYQIRAAAILNAWAKGTLVVAPPVEETPEAKLLAGVMWLQAKCADQAKRLVEAAPKVEHYDRFADAKGRYGLQQAARILGQHPNKWIEQLVADGYLHRQGGKPVPRVDYLGRYFEVKEVLSDGKAFCQTYVTPKGLEYFGARVGSLAPTPEARP